MIYLLHSKSFGFELAFVQLTFFFCSGMKFGFTRGVILKMIAPLGFSSEVTQKSEIRRLMPSPAKIDG